MSLARITWPRAPLPIAGGAAVLAGGIGAAWPIMAAGDLGVHRS